VRAVEVARVAERQVLHDFRQVSVCNLDNQVQLVRHQAIAVNFVAEALNTFSNQGFKIFAICVCREDFLAAVAMQRNVIQSAWNIISCQESDWSSSCSG